MSSWKRLNRGFLTELRKQFLIWRTVDQEVKDEYTGEGRQYLESLHAAGGVTSFGTESA